MLSSSLEVVATLSRASYQDTLPRGSAGSSILSLAVFGFPASPMMTWPLSLSCWSLPGTDWPIGSFCEASLNAELVSSDTGGGGPEGEPVGVAAGGTLAEANA